MLKAKPCLIVFMVSLLIVAMASNVFAINNKVTIIKPNTYAGQNLDQTKIINVVEKAFGLNSPNSNYKEAKVKIINSPASYGDTAGYLVVYLANKKTYNLEIVKIDLNKDYSVRNLTRNYQEQDQDYRQYQRNGESYAGSKSDDDIEAVFATSVEDIPTAVSGVNQAAATARAAGYKVKVLIGNEATVSAYKYWLNKPNVKVFGNIGHGYTGGIMLKDGVLSYRDFGQMRQGTLQNKVLYFNSCQTFNDPLKGSIIDTARAQKFIGGIPNLYIGPSEEVFKAFWKKVLAEKRPMTSSLKEAETSTRYPEPGAHAIGGYGSEYVKRPGSNSNSNPNPNPTPTPTPTTNQWQPNTYYKIGAVVNYNGQLYKCLQAHTAIRSWEPPYTPALWQAQGRAAK